MVLTLCVLRLAYDSQLSFETPQTTSAMDLLGRFLGMTIVPAMALSLLAAHYRQRPLVLSFMIIGSVFCTVFAILNLTGNVAFQYSSQWNEGRAGLAKVDPISLANVAALSLLASVTYFWTTPTLSLQRKAAAMVSIVGPFYVLLVAGSRSPIVALTVTALFILFVQRRFLLLGFGGLTAFVIAPAIIQSDLLLVSRFKDLENDPSALERIAIQSSSWQSFLEHPLTGAYYVDPIYLDYPHNIILHAGLALGVIGILLLLFTLTRGLIIALAMARQRSVFLPLVYVYCLVMAQFSGDLYLNILWFPLVILLGSARFYVRGNEFGSGRAHATLPLAKHFANASAVRPSVR